MAPRERRDLLEATEESFDEVMDANLKGPYFLTQAAARWMQQNGSGRIVFITSISAYTSSPNRGEYCVSKAGLSMAVALFADRLAGDGITVFEIRPGIIRTDMVAPVLAKYEKFGGGRAAAPEPPGNPRGHRPSRAVHRRRTLGLRHRTSIRRRRRVPPPPTLACISHHPTAEARDTSTRTSLRLLAVLNVLFKYACARQAARALFPPPG